jgi:acetyl-CoA synthetase
MYEGAPNHPDFGRFWKMIEEYGVTIFYTAPTAIRAFIKAGDHFPAASIFPRCAVRLGRRADQPGGMELVSQAHRRRQMPDRRYLVADRDRSHPDHPAARSHAAQGGHRHAALLRHRCRDPRRRRQGVQTGPGRPPGDPQAVAIDDPHDLRRQGALQENLLVRLSRLYTAGDGARRDKDGNFWIIGRLDDVLNVSGHRLGTAEIESALVSHPAVAEAAVIGRPDDLKGQAVAAFVTSKRISPNPRNSARSCAATSAR